MSAPHGVVERFADAVTVTLGRRIGPDENFFDAGLDSLLLETLYEQVTRGAAGHFPITDLFAHPNLRALSQRWCGSGEDGDGGHDPASAGTRRPRIASAVAQIGRRRRELRTGGVGPADGAGRAPAGQPPSHPGGGS
jgi:hypothetical protein